MSRNDVTSTRAIVIQSARPAVLEAVTDFAATIERELDRDETFVRERIDALATHSNAPGDAHLEQLRAKADLLLRFMLEVSWLRSTDIAQLYGLDPAKPDRWKAERRIFSMTFGDVEQFPIFQFADGQPIAAMRDILALFAALSQLQIALWFFAPNAWLDNARPMDVLQRLPEAVIEAARRAVEPLEV